ncbi:MAG: Na+/H+ antiporter subunit E [Rhizobiales bacterium]|nr:Na+/H+ antiporter subunit E [Hyphomicrobiales bacterium]NRB13414.1 Na+/H+ antiporter subunit E [Hyphomicrobiales bacterium]
MRIFTLHIVLSLAWAAIAGNFSLLNLAVGFVFGFLAIWLVREQLGAPLYFRKSRKIIALTLLFIYELVLSTIKVAILVIKPKLDFAPGIIAFPLTAKSDIEITLLANLITLTPGTLSVDVSDDKKTLYVHAIDATDPEAMIADIANGFEKKVMEVFD